MGGYHPKGGNQGIEQNVSWDWGEKDEFGGDYIKKQKGLGMIRCEKLEKNQNYKCTHKESMY